MNDMLANPFWHALETEHSRFAIASGAAGRYPPDILPFAGVSQPNPDSLTSLCTLLAPGEAIYITGDSITLPAGLLKLGELPGLQMHFPKSSPIPDDPASTAIRKLQEADASAMVALTGVAFPGYFRARTFELGSYFGIFDNERLIAMAGERIAVPGWREISAVCTHPDHTGKGYAAALVRHLLRFHADRTLRSFLHVAAANTRAITLYERLGFVSVRPMLFHQLQRPPG